MTDMRIGVVGGAGRMGMALVREIHETLGCRLSGAIEHAGHAAIDQDAGTVAGLEPLGIAIRQDAETLFADSDAVLEFSTPAATVYHAGLAAAAKTSHIIGTTGLDVDQQQSLRTAAAQTPIMWAPNMSVGVNLLLELTRQAAAALDDHYDIEIVEMHHKHKVDAPSGTALALGRAAAAGRGVDLESQSDRGRDGITGPRQTGHIGFAVLRGGDVVGDHTVVLAGDGERVELTHKSASRRIFAAGAVRAALWTRDQSPGLYGMRDVLGFSR